MLFLRPVVRQPFVRGCLACVVGLLASAHGAFAQSGAPGTFDVEAYDVDGAKLLRQVDVEAAVYPFLGPGRTRNDIGHAREALEKAYRDRGYQSVVVEIPPQSVSDNIVRLHVVEAAVGRLRVTGSRFFSPEFIRQQVPAFQEGQVPNIDLAQKQLADANRLADRRVTPLLRAGQVPGTVDVDLKVSDTVPVHASVELNNDHNQNTPPNRIVATASYNNLWQLGHSLSFTYLVAPENRDASEIYAGSYLAPLWGTPWSLLIDGYSSNSNVATLGGTNVLGKGYAIGGRAIVQLPARGDVSQSLSVGFDYKTFNENIGIAGTAATTDVIHYWPVSLAYNLNRDGPQFTTKASLSVTLGTRGAGSGVAVFQIKRADANPNFIHFNLDLTQTEALGHGFEAAQRLSGQLSDQPLVSSEQFAAGGLTSVRGYLQSEAVGDDGFSGSFELRTPSLAAALGNVLDDLRFYTFADGAVVSVRHPLPGQVGLFDEASLGLGLRLQLLKHIKTDVLGAAPLINGAATRADRPQITFSVRSEY